MRVGFCGLGRMGRPMAANLVAAGHEVRAWNRSAGKVPAGARECGSAREAAQGADVVVTMLADDSACESVSREVMEALPQTGIHCSMSTISVQLSRRLADEHRRRNQRYVAAPVFGRPEAAQARKLWIVAAGDASAVERCQPLFEALGQGVFPLGASAEHASLLKLCGNFVIASLIEMFGETLSLGEKGGIDPAQLAEVLGRILFAGAAIPTGYAQRIAGTQFEPAAFAMPLGLKDVSLALKAGEELRVPLPLAALLRDHFLESLAKGREKWDWGGMAAVLRESAGLPSRR
ncbi:MAG TPA: NAD(P)-dependent oxidoreductase [Myxococcales bacterium]|nr:NAD(P)-dependent oxidoreductase [Myxococcales bacterium]